MKKKLAALTLSLIALVGATVATASSADASEQGRFSARF